MARMVNCVKLKKEAEGLDYPPFPGALGARIWREVSKEAWAEWTRLQTMMVNEYGDAEGVQVPENFVPPKP